MAENVDSIGEPEGKKRLGLDLRPLRGSRDYRSIFLAGFVGTIGGQGTYVVIPYQMKILTGSFIDVGLLGAVEVVPLIVFGILGGTLADTVDKRRMILWTEATMLVGTLGLLVNAIDGHPRAWVLFVAAALFAGADGLQRPSLDSIVPRLVSHDQLSAASSLSTFRWTFGSIIGPIVGGTAAVAIGAGAWYAVDSATFAVSLACFFAIASQPPRGPTERPSISHVFSGVGYAVTRRDLLGTYLVDFSAMLFAFPVALFPWLAARFHDTFALGLLYAGLPLGAFIASLLSHWTSRVTRHGRAIVLSAGVWGLAVAAFGMADNLLLAVLALCVAGGADACSGIFRGTMWNSSIPDELRGRMAGLELVSYSTGPELGQMRSSLMASWTSLRTSIVSGGLICSLSCAALVFVLPTMWRFNAATDPNVAEVRAAHDREHPGSKRVLEE